jgi:hypothetical protein
MRIVQDKTFTNETIDLDETRFIRCEFEHCTINGLAERLRLTALFFSPDTAFVFDGVAGKVIGMLNLLGMIKPVFKTESPTTN